MPADAAAAAPRRRSRARVFVVRCSGRSWGRPLWSLGRFSEASPPSYASRAQLFLPPVVRLREPPRSSLELRPAEGLSATAAARAAPWKARVNPATHFTAMMRSATRGARAAARAAAAGLPARPAAAARAFSDGRVYGGLKDQDRIFTNLYARPRGPRLCAPFESPTPARRRRENRRKRRSSRRQTRRPSTETPRHLRRVGCRRRGRVAAPPRGATWIFRGWVGRRRRAISGGRRCRRRGRVGAGTASRTGASSTRRSAATGTGRRTSCGWARTGSSRR